MAFARSWVSAPISAGIVVLEGGVQADHRDVARFECLVILSVQGIPYCVLKTHVNFKRFVCDREMSMQEGLPRVHRVVAGLPAVAPTLCKAIFALTQNRVRRLPMIRGGQFITA
jgi:hypothetical protein